MKNLGFWRALPALAALLIAGCVTEEKQLYVTTSFGASRTASVSGPPQIFAGTDKPRLDNIRMFVDGFGLVGHSEFSGTRGDFRPELEQATKVGATHVLIAAKRDSASPALKPMTTSTTRETYERGTYGDTQGTLAAFIADNSIAVSQSGANDEKREPPTAYYYAPMEPRGIGVWLADANARDKQRIGAQAAAVIFAVRRDSAAAKAGLLPGDLIATVDGIPYDGPNGFVGYLGIAKGRDVAVGVLRGNQRSVITLPVPADYR